MLGARHQLRQLYVELEVNVVHHFGSFKHKDRLSLHLILHWNLPHLLFHVEFEIYFFHQNFSEFILRSHLFWLFFAVEARFVVNLGQLLHNLGVSLASVKGNCEVLLSDVTLFASLSRNLHHYLLVLLGGFLDTLSILLHHLLFVEGESFFHKILLAWFEFHEGCH